MDKLSFDMRDNVTLIKYTKPDGTTGTKSVSTADLCGVFTKQVRRSSIIVPPNCRQIIENGNKVTYVMITPPYNGKCALSWGSDDNSRYGRHDNAKLPKEYAGVYDSSNVRVFNVPFPASAVAVQFVQAENKLSFRNMFAFALKDHNVPYELMEACYWPFTNMYSDNRVCIGSIPGSPPTIDAVSSYPRFLYSGLGNHDLDGHFRINERADSLGKFERPYAFITALHNQEVFPTEYLHSIGPLNSVVASTIANYT